MNNYKKTLEVAKISLSKTAYANTYLKIDEENFTYTEYDFSCSFSARIKNDDEVGNLKFIIQDARFINDIYGYVIEIFVDKLTNELYSIDVINSSPYEMYEKVIDWATIKTEIIRE
jgi:hypothetical protein